MPKINPRALPHVLPVKIAEAEVAKRKKRPSPFPESFTDWEGSETYWSPEWFTRQPISLTSIKHFMRW